MYELTDNKALPDYPIAYDAAKALHAAASAKGNHEFAAYWAGQGAPLVRELPAATLMNQLIEEWRAASDTPKKIENQARPRVPDPAGWAACSA